jgi:hypothetical protein
VSATPTVTNSPFGLVFSGDVCADVINNVAEMPAGRIAAAAGRIKHAEMLEGAVANSRE